MGRRGLASLGYLTLVVSASSRLGKFPLKVPNFSIFFPAALKKYHRVWSKNTWFVLLFTAGQKDA